LCGGGWEQSVFGEQVVQPPELAVGDIDELVVGRRRALDEIGRHLVNLRKQPPQRLPHFRFHWCWGRGCGSDHIAPDEERIAVDGEKLRVLA
jgi:hypothetical protein